MLISATYICPVRGLAGLEPPEPIRLGQAAKVAKSLGIERLMLPVLEESHLVLWLKNLVRSMHVNGR